MDLKIFFSLSLIAISLLTFTLSYRSSRQGKFYTDTYYFIPLGIYVWGDGLVVSFFWLLSSFILAFLPFILFLRLVLLFYFFRSFYEVIYWLVHQASAKDYNPPLFRNFKWLTANESAILYQLIHTISLVLFSFLFLLSF